ncbi:hypothetical protein [Actinomadura sp. WAC 06369]|uniref:hypothetical protein n=1 Tax=Actinomadura sp. WAC 06369 TaxID=2203193 RepID=UPI000F76F8C7|nr:hypothetical protein [Actinomadura sp. WAC 06369]RSN67278.1 hypothetical protein DMH08_14025 [Actinomadura sp. WAC 06369]
MPEIAAAVPDVCVVVAGEGDRAGVRRIAARAGLSARVRTLGFAVHAVLVTGLAAGALRLLARRLRLRGAAGA